MRNLKIARLGYKLPKLIIGRYAICGESIDYAQYYSEGVDSSGEVNEDYFWIYFSWGRSRGNNIPISGDSVQPALDYLNSHDCFFMVPTSPGKSLYVNLNNIAACIRCSDDNDTVNTNDIMINFYNGVYIMVNNNTGGDALWDKFCEI
jgi:hypothetical protein